MRNKKTKIVATISDLNCSIKFIKTLYKQGMDVVRINTAHQIPKDSLRIVKNAREVSEELAILVDTKGPEVRTNKSVSGIVFKTGSFIHVMYSKDKLCNNNVVYVSYKHFARDLKKDCSILIGDKGIELKVISKNKDALKCKIVSGGEINQDKKSVNVSGARIKLPSLSKKDKDYVDFCIKNDIEFIAHSLVRDKNDILAIQKILDKHKSHVKIIAKIENQEGVDNIDEILDHAYGIMVARGDLGIVLPPEKIPYIQKRIIKKCIIRSKPVITATQMLESMIQSPKPTRAEVSDVANAIYDGTDAVMLSGETANGNYPVEAITIMSKIAKEVEAKKAALIKAPVIGGGLVRHFLSKSAVHASLDLPTKAIIIPTRSGVSAKMVSSYRGKNIIYAQCFSKRVMRELSLSYGIHPNYMEKPSSTDKLVHGALTPLVKSRKLLLNDLVIILAGTPGNDKTGSNFLEINTVKKALKNYKK